jgi:hypothetical protein
MNDTTKRPDPKDEQHALAQLLARLRAELGGGSLPLPPDDAPPPPRAWSDLDDGEGA